MFSSVENLMARILPVLIFERLVGAMLILVASSFSDIFLSAITRSRRKIIGMDFSQSLVNVGLKQGRIFKCNRKEN